jgi:hypothetical protein
MRSARVRDDFSLLFLSFLFCFFVLFFFLSFFLFLYFSSHLVRLESVCPSAVTISLFIQKLILMLMYSIKTYIGVVEKPRNDGTNFSRCSEQ